MQTDFFNNPIELIFVIMENNDDFLLTIHDAIELEEHSQLEIEEQLSAKVSPAINSP